MPGSIKKIKWCTVRLVFLGFSMLALLSGGLLGYLFGPVFTWYFTGSFNFLKYHRRSYDLVFCVYGMIWLWLREPKFRKAFRIRLTATPRMSPDLNRFVISESWDGELDSCNGCVKCCLVICCPILDKATGMCEAYGSVYWRYFSCGRFPETQEHLDFYGCEKWQMIRDSRSN